MKQKIYELLMKTHRGLLAKTYQQVFYNDCGLSAIKTFEDYLADFYIYLYEAKPKYISDDVKGYYLQQIRDEKATPAWLRQTFKRFLLEENKILTEMCEALAEYRKQLSSVKSWHAPDITLMHVGFAIAWFNQHESSEDRYLFFRSAYKHFIGFYSWPADDLDDKDVSNILGITPGALRTRTSRLCDKVKRLVNELSDALIAALNKKSMETAREIYADLNPDMESILERLLGESERDLDQYEQIVALRKEKQLSCRAFENLDSIMPDSMCSPCFYSISTGEEEYEEFIFKEIPVQSNRIVRMFKELIRMK